jgi:F0F1-type ATP synthase membrane subunit b/b'
VENRSPAVEQLAKIAEQFGLTETIFVQFAVFIAAYWILKAVLFTGYQDLILRRRKALLEDKDTAKTLEEKASSSRAAVDQKLRQAQRTISENVAKTLRDTKTSYDQKISDARAKSQEAIQKKWESLAASKQKSLQDIQSEKAALKASIRQSLLEN